MIEIKIEIQEGKDSVCSSIIRGSNTLECQEASYMLSQIQEQLNRD